MLKKEVHDGPIAMSNWRACNAQRSPPINAHGRSSRPDAASGRARSAQALRSLVASRVPAF